MLALLKRFVFVNNLSGAKDGRHFQFVVKSQFRRQDESNRILEKRAQRQR